MNFPWHWLRRLVARMPPSVAHRVNHDDYFTKPWIVGTPNNPILTIRQFCVKKGR